jgi:multidrug efflux pump subunit AcrB
LYEAGDALALIGVLLFPLTLVRLISYLMPRKGVSCYNNRPVAWSKSVYLLVLDQSLRHLRSILAIALAAFAASWLLAPCPGSECLSEFDAGSIWANLRLPASVSYHQAARMLHQVRATLLQSPKVRTTVSRSRQPGDEPTPRNSKTPQDNPRQPKTPQHTPTHPNTIKDNPRQSAWPKCWLTSSRSRCGAWASPASNFFRKWSAQSPPCLVWK